jgi:hypothetical protein
MACFTDPASCPRDLAGAAVQGATNGLADSLREGAHWVMDTAMGWWVNVPSIDLKTTPVQQIQGQVRWIAIAVAVAGMTWQGIRMAVSRKPGPIFDIGKGLITMALWSAIGIIGVQFALSAADSYSTWVLDQAAQGQAQEKLTGLAEMAQVQSSGAVIVLSLIMIVAGIAQAVLMFFREGAIIMLSGLVVLAAAGAFTGSTRPWIHKWLGWMLALVLYKPVAATVYAVAIQVVGDGRDTRTIFIGLTMVVMSLIALPTLMKLFHFAVPAASAASAGGVGALSSGATAGIYAMNMRGLSGPGGGGGVEQARMLSRDLGPGAGPGGPSGSASVSGGGPSLSPSGAGFASPVAAITPPAAAPSGAAAGAAGAGSGAAAGGSSAAAAGAGPAGLAIVAAQGAAQVGSSAVGKAGSAMAGETP